MAKTSATYREEVLKILSDHKWHSVLDLIAVGGVRAPSRVHELRRGEDGGPQRRILNVVRDSVSKYRWVCNCGPLPEAPDPSIVPFCDDCRAALAELESPQDAGEPAPPSQPTCPAPAPCPPAGQQMSLFRGGGSR